MEGKDKSSKIVKAVIVILVVLIVVITGILVYSLHNKSEQLTNNIVGTFQTDATGHDSTYLVFTSDKRFVYYRQFKLLYKGKYEQEKYYARIYTMRDSSGKPKGQVLLYGKSLYFLKGGTNEYIEFSKTDDEPTYINLEKD